MKRLISLSVCLCLLAMCIPCAVQAEAAFQNPRILIAYFSLYGNVDYPDDVDATTSASIVLEGDGKYGATQVLARLIQSRLGGDLCLIQTAQTYPDSFQAVIDQNHQEAANGTQPALRSIVENMGQYDVIFLGYPIWNMTVPQAIHTFLTAYDFAGKTIIPFCTHDGYGSGQGYRDIASVCVYSTVLEGLAVESTEILDSNEAVYAWLDSLNMSFEEKRAEIPIDILIGDATLSAVLYDTSEAKQFLEMLPMTISMWNYGGREFYGALDGDIAPEGEGQPFFADGDITYCDANQTVAIFYSQSDRPNLTMRVIPFGRVTSELEPFLTWSGNAKITFSLSH